MESDGLPKTGEPLAPVETFGLPVSRGDLRVLGGGADEFLLRVASCF